MSGGQKDLLISRLDDTVKRSERGEVAFTVFLSPAELSVAKDHLCRCGLNGLFFIRGGYDGAERARLFCIPDYMYGACKDGELIEPCDFEELEEVVSDAVAVLEIRGSGYRELTHKDYLGSILALGLERDALGDVALTDKYGALVVTSRKIADFLSDELSRVASDVVKARILSPDEVPKVHREIKEISDTVASARLDCIISALTGMSRESAQSAIRSGLVQVDYRPADSPDRQVLAPSVIVVRGHGKFILRQFAGETKKGRLRIVAGKYI